MIIRNTVFILKYCKIVYIEPQTIIPGTVPPYRAPINLQYIQYSILPGTVHAVSTAPG